MSTIFSEGSKPPSCDKREGYHKKGKSDGGGIIIITLINEVFSKTITRINGRDRGTKRTNGGCKESSG